MSNRINILADTNSLGHLSEVGYRIGNDASNWLYKYFNVFQLQIIHEELTRNIKRKRSRIFRKQVGRKYNQNAVPFHIKQIDIIDEKIISNYYSKFLGNDDRGERYLIGHAIAAVKTGKFDYCIILTDDYSAYTKFLNKIKQDFVFGDIWNVFDLILYLYLTKNTVSHQSSALAIRELIALSSISAKKYRSHDMSDSDARIQMLNDYLKKLDQISILKTII